jgi:hypothetical protein
MLGQAEQLEAADWLYEAEAAYAAAAVPDLAIDMYRRRRAHTELLRAVSAWRPVCVSGANAGCGVSARAFGVATVTCYSLPTHDARARWVQL